MMPAIHLTAYGKDNCRLAVCIQVPADALASDGTLTDAQVQLCFQAVREQMPAFSDDLTLGYRDADSFVFEYLDEQSTPVFKEIYTGYQLPKYLFRCVLTVGNFKINRSQPIKRRGFVTLCLPKI
jgi:hypothetical protein